MNILDSLFCHYGTDKSSKSHNFSGIYDAVLNSARFNVRKVVEIGIGITPPIAGASLKAWADYFPNALIYGVDLHDFSFINADRITTIIADQGLIPDNLERIIAQTGGNLDLIIDDGSHQMHHHQISLGYLFRHLKPGGYYIIEDLSTSYHDFWNPTGTQYNTMLMLEMIQHTGVVLSDHISDDDKLYLQEHIERCDIYKVTPLISETAVLKKKCTV